MNAFRSPLGFGFAALAALAALGPASTSVAAQDDVEMLGRPYGARPPAAYYELKARNPGAFEFSRGWRARNPRLDRVGEDARGRPEFRMRADAGTSG
ncbi:MAG: hypothetical protein HKN71_02545, partial [Gemmatimonadetes bacterium]|nr:hypothetical protein [Gemmatimonadota bacterium]